MSRLPKGLRRVAGGWNDPFRKPRPAAAQPVPKTPEQIAASEKAYQDFIEEKGWNKPTAPTEAEVDDAAARVAVEGDTDLNHDNVEAAE